MKPLFEIKIEQEIGMAKILCRGPYIDKITPVIRIHTGLASAVNCFNPPLTEDELRTLAESLIEGIRRVQGQRALEEKVAEHLAVDGQKTIAEIVGV